MIEDKVDVLIIGAGVGGLCTAARLAANGLKVMVAERLPFVGGRFSSRDVKGFQVSTGAIMVPFGDSSAFQEAFTLLGAEMAVREPTGGFRYRLSHGDYDVPPEGGGGLPGMLQFATGDEAEAARLANEFRRAMIWWRPDDGISFKDWLNQFTENEAVHNLFQGFCAAFIGVSSFEVPAGEFFRFLKNMGRANKYGVAIEGNIALMNALEERIREKGSTVSTKTKCKGIIVEKSRARGAVLQSEGQERTVMARYVVCNAGPGATVSLAGRKHFERSYLHLLERHSPVTPVVHICLASDEPLSDFPGIVNFGNSSNLIFLETPTITCPELAPAGKHITTTFSVPENSRPPLKMKAAVKGALTDLQNNFPDFDKRSQILFIASHKGEWPSMRRWPGYPMPVRTSVENLYNVGDGCMPKGTVGIEACAQTAKIVAGEILAAKRA